MKLFGLFGGASKAAAPDRRVRAESTGGVTFSGLNDPALLEYIRGSGLGGGAHTPGQALQNMAALRCVSLISESIGMMPLNLMRAGNERAHAVDHPVYRLLKTRPNGWQTPFEFKSMLQLQALAYGNGYARVVWSMGRPVNLIPLESTRMVAKLTPAWEMRYRYTRDDGVLVDLAANEVFHLRDLTLDGVTGLSRMKLARQALGIAASAQQAAVRMFENGVMAGGALATEKQLSDEAYARLQTSLDEKTGPEKAGKWLILEEGLTAEKLTATATDAQHIENRQHQIEEVARAFGVPRPLLMMDDTSWGSGMEQLGLFFIQYGLAHWFTAWEQAVARSLLSEVDQGRYVVKFNDRALLRGTHKDQNESFARSLGSGGHAAWMTQNEVRDLQDLPPSDDPEANKLRGPQQKGKLNESDKTA